MPKVFEGIKVLDFTWAGVGPITTKYLADYGATVIRVESSTHPDILRTSPPYKDGIPGLDRAAYWAYFNCNKYSVSINMRHPKGVELVKRLVAWADIVAESFVAGMMERWGLGYEELKKIKPDIIMYRTNIQGCTGPYCQIRGTGVNLAGLSGFVHLSGWADRSPIIPYGPYNDFIAPRFGASMLIAALDYRRKTGKGQLLDMSQFEAGVNFLAPVMLDYFVNGRAADRAGNSCPEAAPHNAYRCRGEDAWCAISVFSDEEWQAFCRVIGNPAWTRDKKFSSAAARKENEAELDRLVEAWTAKHTPKEVMTAMQAAGVAAGIVATSQDVFEDPQFKARNHFWVMKHKVLGEFPHLGELGVLSETPGEGRMPAPCIGEHNEYVCTTLLGMPDDEFVALLAEGVFE